jgi:hypothetical protein
VPVGLLVAVGVPLMVAASPWPTVTGARAPRADAVDVPGALAVTAATIVGAQATAHLLGRLGGRPVAATGFALAPAGMALLAASSAGSDAFTGVLPGFAAAAAWLLPPGRPATDTPVFGH